MTSPQFTTGIAQFNKSIENSTKRAEAAKLGGGGRIGYFNWKPGDVKILRFLTDELIMADFYEFIVTTQTGRPGPKGPLGTQNFMVPPSDPHILDRYRSPNPGIGWRQNFKTKAYEDPKPREVGCGIAVLRDQKPGPEGKLVLEDYLYEQEIEGTSYLSRQFGIVQQSVSNFWHTLVVSCYAQFGTLCDRDYRIERTGNGFDTKYSIIPLGEDPDLNSVEKVQGFYFYGSKYDKDDPQRYLKCPQTLVDWAEYYSGKERYEWWLTPGKGADAPKDAQDGAPVMAPPTYTPPTYTPPTTPVADEAQAGLPPAVSSAPPASTSFSSFKDDLIKQAEAQAAQK